MKKMKWPCIITASNVHPSGRKVTMRRIVDGAGNVEAAMLHALKSRRDGGRFFHGDEVRAITPLGQTVRRLFNYDDTLTPIT